MSPCCGVLSDDADLSATAVEEHLEAEKADSLLRISYGALLGYAAHLAGVLPRGCVALLCEGAAFATAFFAVVRCGRIALPLNPHDPPARLRMIIDDADAKAALVHGDADDIRQMFPELDVFQVFGGTAPALAPSAQDAELCYLVYTSGSTGRPKGVAVEHRHLRLYCDATNACTGLDRGARTLVATAVSWDPCLSEAMRTLHAGGACVFVERDWLLQDLAGQLAALRISHVFATPSWWSLLERSPGDVRGISAGEPFRPPLAALVPRVRNMYGVTEGTVAQTLGPEGGSAHAGWTIDAAAVAVEITAEGEREGEIVMAGPMIARGYWRGAGFDGRFATGDRGRLGEDGALHVLGRMDQQVKVRGHRVELGEVEAALRGLPGVRDVVVLLRGESLVACCEPLEEAPGGVELAPASWSAGLAEVLPAAFRPAPLFVGRLPRLENGKVDRREAALAIEAFGGSGAMGGAPAMGLERTLAELWASVLPPGAVIGRDDSWFALGGTSLAAVRLQRLLAGALAEVGLSVDRRVAWCGLHRHPTVRRYAAFLEWASSAPEAMLAAAEQLDNPDPLCAAVARDDIEACGTLLRASSSPNGAWEPSRPCETPLHHAARRGSVAAIGLLLDAGAKLTAHARGKVLPVHVAAQGGHGAALSRLADAGAPLDARDWNRWSPLFFAVSAGSAEAVDLLVGLRCALSVRDRWGRTALSWACARGAEAVARRLLEARASPGQRLQARQAERWQTDWKPELHHALAHQGCLGLLLESGFPMSTDLRGRPPLLAAVEGGHLDAARRLLDARCAVDVATATAAGVEDRFRFLLDLRPRMGREETGAAPPTRTLLFDIPPWPPSEVRRAVQSACGRGSHVSVESSGQGGVCLGTAVVDRHVEDAVLVLRGGSLGDVEVQVARASAQRGVDRAFPRAPLQLREQLRLEDGEQGATPPPGVGALVSALSDLLAGEPPEGSDAWLWPAWSAWSSSRPGRRRGVAMADPGRLGLHVLYEGVPSAEVLRADDAWRRSAALLSAWRGLPDGAEAPLLVVGAASAADAVGGSAALLWAVAWPWAEATLELPTPGGGALLLLLPAEVSSGAVGAAAVALAQAWHGAQPWRESRGARRLWRGGQMGER